MEQEIATTGRRMNEVGEELLQIESEMVEESDLRSALSLFKPVWEQLSPKEQYRAMQLLLESVDYDGEAGTVASA